MIGIYKITSPSGRIYIGQSWNIQQRWKQHSCGRDKTHLGSSIRKYGADSHQFETIHELPHDINQSVMDGYEDLFISQYKECGVSLMNLKGGGSHGLLTDEFKKKLSESSVGKNKGAIRSPETRAKMSLSRIGKPLTEAHKEKIRAKRIGTKVSDETRLKHSLNAGRGYKWTCPGGNQWKAKKVIDTLTGMIHETIASAAEANGLKRRTLEAMLSGQNKNRTTLIYA